MLLTGLLGSVSQKVARHAQVPVVVVHDHDRKGYAYPGSRLVEPSVSGPSPLENGEALAERRAGGGCQGGRFTSPFGAQTGEPDHDGSLMFG